MMEQFLDGTAIDAIGVILGTNTLSQTSTEKTENGWKTKTVEVITVDGKMHTYVTELKLDGTEQFPCRSRTWRRWRRKPWQIKTTSERSRSRK
jgi:hypothetical protein